MRQTLSERACAPLQAGPRQLSLGGDAGSTPGDACSNAKGLELALVLWSGNVGGAEALKATLAREWRRWGVAASVVFVTSGAPLEEQLDRDGVGHVSVGMSRGRDAVFHPRRLARAVAAAGPDGALLADSGFLAAALRAGGYRGRIVGVEHGKLLAAQSLSRARRLMDRIERSLGARFRDVDVGVSDFMLDEILRHPHARSVCRVYNGVDVNLFTSSEHPAAAKSSFVVGTAARLVPGKGVDVLLRAAAQLRDERVRFRAKLGELGVRHRRGGSRDPENQAFIESWFEKLKRTGGVVERVRDPRPSPPRDQQLGRPLPAAGFITLAMRRRGSPRPTTGSY